MSFVHGQDCRSRTWRTKCQGCSDPVFFFSCECGSKVFFDDLGPPWPIHDCDTSWTRNLIRRRRPDGGHEVELSEGVTVSRAPDTFNVLRNAYESAANPELQDKPDPIKAIKPKANGPAVPIIGLVREKYASVDVFSNFGVTRGSLGAEMIGDLSQGKWGRITIHEPSIEKGLRNSYTFWVRTEMIVDPNNSKGVTVMTSIKPLSIPGGETVWVALSYEVLG